MVQPLPELELQLARGAPEALQPERAELAAFPREPLQPASVRAAPRVPAAESVAILEALRQA